MNTAIKVNHLTKIYKLYDKMRQFASVYVDKQFVQEVLAQMSWDNNLTLNAKSQ